MKTKLLCLMLAVLSVFCAAACKKTEETPIESTPEPTPETAIVVVEEMPVHSDSWEDILAEEVPPPEAEDVPGNFSVTTGRELDAAHTYKPVFVCLDNATDCRPLSGLAEADIVYEAPAQAGGDGTRLLALFSDAYPAQVGPLKASLEALESIQREWGGLSVYADNADDKPYFVAPDGVEGTFVDLEKLVPALFTADAPAAGVRFLLAEGYPYGDAAAAAKRFRLVFGGGKGERVEYTFDAEQHAYRRKQADAEGNMVGTTALSWNEESSAYEKMPVLINSVIVQYVESGDAGLMLTGSGKCDFFTNGLRIKGTWSRASEDAQTEYFLEDGRVVTVESGHTWVALHPSGKSAEVF